MGESGSYLLDINCDVIQDNSSFNEPMHYITLDFFCAFWSLTLRSGNRGIPGSFFSSCNENLTQAQNGTILGPTWFYWNSYLCFCRILWIPRVTFKGSKSLLDLPMLERLSPCMNYVGNHSLLQTPSDSALFHPNHHLYTFGTHDPQLKDL